MFPNQVKRDERMIECQKGVPRTYITTQDLRGIVCMGVSFTGLYVSVKG